MNVISFLIILVIKFIINMAEIARNAFTSRNYRLALEIYERCLKDKQTSMDIHFGYADSLAKCGNVREALDVYSFCYRNNIRNHFLNNHNTNNINPEHLRHVVSALLDTITSGYKPTISKVLDILTCVVCDDILNVPITLLCGHTVCRKCEIKDKNRNCRKCGQVKQQQILETNVLIKNLIEKWWPHLLKSSQLRDDGNDLFQKGDLELALQKYNEASELAPDNTLVLGNRSHVLLRLNRAQAALQDADHVVRIRPTWGKGHYRRGMALTSLGRHEEALQALCVCVALDRNPQAIKHDLALVLHRLLLPSLRNRGHTSPQSPYWRDQGRRGSGSSSSFLRMSPSKSPARRSACLRGGSSDCEDSSGEDEDMADIPASQSSRGHNLQLQADPRLHGIVDRLLQAVDKVKRVDKGSADESSHLINKVIGVVDVNDFDCVLCCRTLWRPVTTPCGHTYCWTCLDRCLDYNHACPLCMAPLAEYLSSNQRSETEFIEKALRGLLPQEWSARQQLYQTELKATEAEKDRTVPVFVCTTAFPTVPCPLFVYEPRYRLMIRRAVESGTRQFGIAACVDQHAVGQRRYAEFGTMLEIRDWLCMSNGCSILSTVGCRRFRVIEGGETDGYDLAKVDFLVDEPITSEKLPGVTRLQDTVRRKAKFWLSTLEQEALAEVMQTFGPMPEPEEDWDSLQDGPAWSWWLLSILPLGNKLKIGILGTTNLEKRLRAIDKTFDYIANQRKAAARAAAASAAQSTSTAASSEGETPMTIQSSESTTDDRTPNQSNT